MIERRITLQVLVRYNPNEIEHSFAPTDRMKRVIEAITNMEVVKWEIIRNAPSIFTDYVP